MSENVLKSTHNSGKMVGVAIKGRSQLKSPQSVMAGATPCSLPKGPGDIPAVKTTPIIRIKAG